MGATVGVEVRGTAAEVVDGKLENDDEVRDGVADGALLDAGLDEEKFKEVNAAFKSPKAL